MTEYNAASLKYFLTDLFTQGVTSCRAEHCMPDHLKDFDRIRLYPDSICMVAIGKAALSMAKTAHAYFAERCFGIAVTRHGYGDIENIGKIKLLYASHPQPDQHSLDAAKHLSAMLTEVPSTTPVLFLISGGGSALVCQPIKGVSFDEKRELNRFLLASGADITEMNQVRKAFSSVKGGKLVLMTQADSYTLAISDVVGDDPATISSGLTYYSKPNLEHVKSILHRYNWPQTHLLEQLDAQANRTSIEVERATKINQNYRIIANAELMLQAAIKQATQLGWQCKLISAEQTGEAREIAQQHAQLALDAKAQNKSILLFSGGELTVTLDKAAGKGGPNQEYLMALALALKGEKGICALACDSDGVDGSEDVAGAFIDEHTLMRAQQLGLDALSMLNSHQSFTFFEQLGDHINPGVTHTNVNDFRVICIQAHTE